MKQIQKETQKQSIQRPQTASNSTQKHHTEDDIQGEEELQQKQRYEQEYQMYENYRSYLLQYQFLNATLKDKMKKQQTKLEIEFTDRLQQLKDIIDNNIQLQTKILRERAINVLEEVLSIEYKNYKDIFSKLDEFSDYASNLQEFLNGSVKKVYIESGLSINIDQVNLYINESSQLIEKVIEKHSDFFREYPQIAQALSEIIQESIVQMKAIKQINDFLIEIKSEQDAKIEEKAKEEYFRSKGFGDENQFNDQIEKQIFKNQIVGEQKNHQHYENSGEEENEVEEQ
ncbi:hypothetical protein ABPG74_008125 [Tetrahymena malaccensis]